MKLDDRPSDPPRAEDAPHGSSVGSSVDPVRNFSLSTEERIRGLTIGVPAYAERKKRIEDMEHAFVTQLAEAHAKASARGADAEAAVARRAATFDLSRINDLVVKHNRYYPIEANLPMEPATGRPMLWGRPFRPEEPFTTERLIAAARAKLGSGR